LVALNETWNVHATVHLAYASEDTKRRMLAVPSPRYTDKTLIDPKAIRERLAKVIEEGVAYDCEEHRRGVCAVAVPVFVKNDMVLALGAVAPVERFTPADVERLIPPLKEAALAMGQRMENMRSSWYSRSE
jgi:DNA-binding IclR family transcriptional regulator